MKSPKKKQPLTDAERHKRFVETAKQIGASEKQADFDDAFKRITEPKKANAERPKPV